MEYDLIRLWLGMISDMGNAALGRILDYFGDLKNCGMFQNMCFGKR